MRRWGGGTGRGEEDQDSRGGMAPSVRPSCFGCGALAYSSFASPAGLPPVAHSGHSVASQRADPACCILEGGIRA
ncbi:hypothetical protein FQA47_021378 [Oryzias melastigma]|uniref:Uncharacterized protein n=1 Tax=Oryzias melastigma TaxID=30732 RepID=A0A834CWH1_ORYME|nr:hypothetical protein FQA47_021378 [Oryzias melastigma]